MSIEIDVVEARMFCKYCQAWGKMGTIMVGQGCLSVRCAKCSMTYCYEIKESRDHKNKGGNSKCLM